MKKHLILLVSTFVTAFLQAKINLCVVNVSHASVVLSPSGTDSYVAQVPDALRESMQVIHHDATLYINESQACPDQTVKVALPPGTALELNIRQNGRVHLLQVTGPVVAQLNEQGGVILQEGHCPALRVAASGHSALVVRGVDVKQASVRAQGPVNIVLDAVQQIQKPQLYDGAAAYINNHLYVGGIRAQKDAPFSLTAAYRRAGLPVSDEMAFYDLCATDHEGVSALDCVGYDGSPLHATHETVGAARDFITSMLPDDDFVPRALDAIAKIPAEYQREREVLGALLSRRLMITVLSQPWGPGVISPVSLLKPHVFSDAALRGQAIDLLENMLKRVESLAARDLTVLGSFGTAFCQRVSSLRRLHDRVAPMRSVRQQPRWAPFLAQLFRDTQTFITTGQQPWDR